MDNICRHFSKETHMANKQILNLTNRGSAINLLAIYPDANCLISLGVSFFNCMKGHNTHHARLLGGLEITYEKCLHSARWQGIKNSSHLEH